MTLHYESVYTLLYDLISNYRIVLEYFKESFEKRCHTLEPYLTFGGIFAFHFLLDDAHLSRRFRIRYDSGHPKRLSMTLLSFRI